MTRALVPILGETCLFPCEAQHLGHGDGDAVGGEVGLGRAQHTGRVMAGGVLYVPLFKIGREYGTVSLPLRQRAAV
ncbi:hypothetical protein ACFXOY_14030 [Streptomyces niveus]|uniref:hypothetical protein n=1 Tax=Streptomyces niveus TaxID=193462 RepID=UPI0036AA794A